MSYWNCERVVRIGSVFTSLECRLEFGVHLWAKKQIKDELAKKKRVQEANRTFVSKILHTTDQILESPVPSSMEALQSNVGLLKEKADGIKNLDSCILELLCEDGSADLEKEIEETSELQVKSWMSSARPKDSRSLKKSRGTRNCTKSISLQSSVKLTKLFIKKILW